LGVIISFAVLHLSVRALLRGGALVAVDMGLISKSWKAGQAEEKQQNAGQLMKVGKSHATWRLVILTDTVASQI
jgi:hypothetical protein